MISRIEKKLEIKGAIGADLVIEAVPEVLELKLDIFRKLDSICPAYAILVTNTSSLPISALAATAGAIQVVASITTRTRNEQNPELLRRK